MLILEIAAGIVLGQSIWWAITHLKNWPPTWLMVFSGRHPIMAKVIFYGLFYTLAFGTLGVGTFFLLMFLAKR